MVVDRANLEMVLLFTSFNFFRDFSEELSKENQMEFFFMMRIIFNLNYSSLCCQ